MMGQILGGQPTMAAPEKVTTIDATEASPSEALSSGALSSEDLSSEEPISASGLFEVHCAGCHTGGGNIIRRGKNLKLKTLKRYQLDQVEAISQVVTQGRGIMSAYRDRLSPAEIEVVSEYVLEQAKAGWR